MTTVIVAGRTLLITMIRATEAIVIDLRTLGMVAGAMKW
jgi:hypothetical protein